MNESTDGKGFYDRIVELLRTDLEEKSALLRWFLWRAKIGYEIVDKFVKDDCFTFAASLAYTTLLALAPLTAVSLSILTSFELSKQSVLAFVFQRLLPNPQIARIIEENVDTFSANAASVSLFGVVFLAIFAVWVLRTIEYVFNSIWRVGRSRPLVSQFVTYWSAVTFAPILIALSIYVTAEIQQIVGSDDWADYTYLQSATLKAIPYLLTWVAFFLVYKLIPYTNVYSRPALWGAVIAGTLFEVAKHAFNWYLTSFATYAAIYGALAVIPIFLFWLYVTWLIVLLGSVIAYAIQYPREIKSAAEEGPDRTRYRTYHALRLLMEAARNFEQGKGHLEPKAAAHALQITEGFYGVLVDRLAALGLVEYLDESSGTFMLRAPADAIAVTRVLLHLDGEAFETAPEPDDADRARIDRFFAAVREAIDREGGRTSIHTLLRDGGASS